MDLKSDVTGYSTFFRENVGETPEPKEGKVSGTVPEWLEGTLYRNGPGKMEVGLDKFNHWFDGLAMIHKFQISKGKVTYTSRFLRSDSYVKDTAANRIVVSEFGTTAFPDPCATLFERVSSIFTRGVTDNANINVVQYGDAIYAVTEIDRIRRIDKDTLETLEKVEIGNYVSVNLATVHPHQEADGTIYNLGNGITSTGTSDLLIKFPKGKEGEDFFKSAIVIGRIRSSSALTPTYHHSFSMTENYFLMVDHSLVFNLAGMACASIRNTAFGTNIKFQPNKKANFTVVEKLTGKVLKTKFVTDTLVMFHQVNAYEDDGHLVLDIVTYEDRIALDIMFRASVESIVQEPTNIFKLKTQLRRYVLPLRDPSQCKVNPKTGLVSLKNTQASAFVRPDGSIYLTPDVISTDYDFFEVPQINYKISNGKKYSYAYGLSRKLQTVQHGIAKINVQTKTSLEWSDPNMMPSEPIYVQRPGAMDEDDGVLLVSTLPVNDQNVSTLVFLDAKTMTETCRVDFDVGHPVSSSIHGTFI